MKAILAATLGTMLLALLSGCGSPHADHNPANASDEKIKAERAKLGEEDQKLVAAQEWCAVDPTHRLGCMGPPVKVMVKDEPVFLCCKGCEPAAVKDPDKTLAKVAELKEKAK